MGNGFSSIWDTVKSIKLPDNPLKDVSLGNKTRNFVKGVGNRIQSIKLPDNPLKDVSLGNKGKNFVKGVSSGIIGPKQVKVQVSTGPFGFRRATQLSSVSSTPMSASGFLGEVVGHTVSRVGRTKTNPIFSSSNEPSLFNRIKKKFKPKSNPIIPSNKPNNIGTSNISQTQQFEQPSQKTQEEFPTQIKGGSKKNPSENKKKPSKKEKKLSENKKKPSKKEKKPSENKKKSKK
jgi:hypothetical protein